MARICTRELSCTRDPKNPAGFMAMSYTSPAEDLEPMVVASSMHPTGDQEITTMSHASLYIKNLH